MNNQYEKYTQLVSVTINGVRYQREIEPRMLLSDFIRNEAMLIGTHVGCEQGVCGACDIIFEGELVRSCLMFAVQANGCEIQTIEGLAEGPDQLHPIQQAFIDNHAIQCGFCTPGMVLTTYNLLKENPDPSDQEIRKGLSGNICRCTGYTNIVKAVKDAAQRLKL
jgi:carbon-monoxide dehydrogenase small subunit